MFISVTSADAKRIFRRSSRESSWNPAERVLITTTRFVFTGNTVIQSVLLISIQSGPAKMRWRRFWTQCPPVLCMSRLPQTLSVPGK